MKRTIETVPFYMPVDIYINMWMQSLLRRHRWWLLLLLSLIVALSFLTSDMIYVAIILGFAAIPTIMIFLFVMRLSHPHTHMLLRERVAHIDDGGIALRYTHGERYHFPWEYVTGYKITRTYIMLYMADGEAPVFLPFSAFGDEQEYIDIEKRVLRILAV
ncbi:MAG: YcxB family protein [Coprobacter sp.]|nr:YcxB family protein [Coprobacter sp.]